MMAERSSGRSSRPGSKSERDRKQQETDKVEREQGAASLLDDPAQPDQASPMRGWVYFATIVVLVLALNLIVMVVVSGGR